MTLLRGAHIAAEVVEGTRTLSEADWQKLVDNAYDHVRLPFKPAWLFTGGSPYTTVNATNMTAYKALITKALSKGLSVVVDCHPIDQTDMDNSWTNLSNIWTRVAGALTAYPVGSDTTLGVYYELRNEPQTSDSSSWTNTYNAAIVAVRAADTTGKYIIPNAMFQADPNGFDPVAPLTDSLNKLIYAFHWYYPFPFTHCGFSYAGYGGITDVRYPGDPMDTARKLNSIGVYSNNEPGRRVGYNIENMIQQLSDHTVAWAKKYGVKLYCSEAGFGGQNTRLEDGHAWTQDFINAMGYFGIGYVLFLYGQPDPTFFPIDDTMHKMVKASATPQPTSFTGEYGAQFASSTLNGVNTPSQGLSVYGQPVTDRNPMPMRLTNGNRAVSNDNPVPMAAAGGFSYNQRNLGIQKGAGSQTLLPADETRNALMIQNPSATATIYIRFNSTDPATIDAWTWKIGPGDYFPKTFFPACKGPIQAITDGTGLNNGDYHGLNVIVA
jgi:hypothetical protein